MNKEEREMITEREEFIKICGILAYSDTHPTDCHYITGFIVKLGKEIEELQNKIDKAIKYINDRMIVEQSFCLDMKQCYELTEILKDSDVDD